MFGDDFISFVPMHISFSPDGRYFLVSTGELAVADKGVLIHLAILWLCRQRQAGPLFLGDWETGEMGMQSSSLLFQPLCTVHRLQISMELLVMTSANQDTVGMLLENTSMG